MVATRELPVSTPPCRSPFYNDLGGEGDYYYNARWYDAETGRFISEDPARDGQNWYTYVRNNPIKYTDPTGMITGVDDAALILLGSATTVAIVATNHTYKMATDPEYREATEGLAKELGNAFRELVETLSDAIENGIELIKTDSQENAQQKGPEEKTSVDPDDVVSMDDVPLGAITREVYDENGEYVGEYVVEGDQKGGAISDLYNVETDAPGVKPAEDVEDDPVDDSPDDDTESDTDI